MNREQWLASRKAGIAIYTLERNRSTEEALVELLVDWWHRHVVADVAPPIDGSESAILRGCSLRYDERMPLKEDYDFSLQHLNRYRCVLRVNKFYYEVRQSERSGGCATYRNIEREKSQLELLRRKWGSEIVRIDTTDRSHSSEKKRTKIDYNPVIHPPIRGV